MQSEESNTLVKLAKAVIEYAPEGGDAFWGIKFIDIEAALSAAEPQPAPSATVKADEIDAQQDINLAANSTMDQSLCDASALIDRVEIFLNRVKASALSAQVQDVAQWQSIETAPRDGTNILVWADGYQWPEVVRYEIYDDPIVEAEAGEKGYWRYSEDLLADIMHIDKDEISHWMPLPAAPAKQEG